MEPIEAQLAGLVGWATMPAYAALVDDLRDAFGRAVGFADTTLARVVALVERADLLTAARGVLLGLRLTLLPTSPNFHRLT